MDFKHTYSYIIAIIIAFSTTSCDKTDNDYENTTQEYFYEYVEIKNPLTEYAIRDTIWFSANINDTLFDTNTGTFITLTNSTYILSGKINLLKPESDSLLFIYHNFDIVDIMGETQLINVINSSSPAYTFDIKFGKPICNNEVKFGVVTNYPGILAMEFEAWVYYGNERDNYDDFSLENHKGYINMSFNTKNTNDSVYYSLPSDYKYAYDNYYTPVMINTNKFFFIYVAGL